MGRGIFSGVIWGSVVAIATLWVASQLGDVINVLRAPPENIEAKAPKAVQISNADPAEAPAAPANRAAPATDPSRQGSGLDASNADTAPDAINEPAGTPQTGAAGDAPAQPETGNAPVLESGAGDASTQNETAAALTTPSVDATPQPIAPPAAPKVTEPEVVEQPTADVSQTDSGERPTSEDAPEATSELSQPEQPAGEVDPVVDFSKPQVVEVPVVEEPVAEPAPGSDAAPEQTAVDEPSIEAPAVTALPEVGTDPSVSGGTESAAQKPAATPGSADKVRTNRLPTIGGDTDEPETEAATEETAEVVVDGPAIQQFAIDFENPEGRPLMAILLLVDPDDPSAANAPAAMPFPVSYVVDASRENAGQIMQAYRRAGHEVVALAPLPADVTPTDVEVAFQSYLSAVPEAVAVMDTRNAVFQSGRSVATQVAEALAATGHGMITYSRGMNSAAQVAERAGVHGAIVFREFDNDGQNTAAIKRFLDQAAFRAGQQTGVILVGHNRPETITALLEWSLGNRASTVALAPVSPVLQAQ